MKFPFARFLLLCLLGAATAFAAPKPNIVFILTDDMGPGDLGCYGGKIAATPNIDRLAREGVRFTHYYSAAPICSPSRCGLITGQFPARWRITSYLQTRKGNRDCGQADFLSAEAPSLPRILHEAGYATAHIGKWHLGGGRDVDDAPKFKAYGYDEHAGTWESPEPHPDITSTNWIWGPNDKFKRWDRTQFFVNQTLDFIARHKNQPCFINLWLDDPHTPWVPAEGTPKGDTRDKLKRVLEENDKQVGRLMDSLPADTLILYASDNGPLPTYEGERSMGLRGSKLSLYDGGIRLPFIARWPGKIPANRVDETTTLAAVDMLPTLTAIGGGKLPAGYRSDGQDMSAALLGKSVARAKPLFWEYGRNNNAYAYPKARDRSPNVAMLEGKWKLVLNTDGGSAELYDLAADPKEAANMAADKPEVTARMKAAALAWRKAMPEAPAPAP
jgi:arylsulfatase A-like enzyme